LESSRFTARSRRRIAKDAPDFCDKRLVTNRLRHESTTSRLESAIAVFLQDMCCQNQYRDFLGQGIALNAPQERQAIQLRHLQIGDYQCGSKLASSPNALVPIRGKRHSEADGLKHASRETGIGKVVLHDKNQWRQFVALHAYATPIR
jgi:hypothetical protein